MGGAGAPGANREAPGAAGMVPAPGPIDKADPPGL